VKVFFLYDLYLKRKNSDCISTVDRYVTCIGCKTSVFFASLDQQLTAWITPYYFSLIKLISNYTVSLEILLLPVFLSLVSLAGEFTCRLMFIMSNDIFKSHHVGPMVCLEHHTIYIFSFLSLFKLTGRQEQTHFQNNGMI